MTKQNKLIGGTNDGALVTVPGWQKIYCIRKKISWDELQRLRIDDVMSWKEPEEFYERESAKEDFKYSKTVNYKPDIG